MPHRVLDVVAEDPEKEHVPEHVAPARVQEHAREHRLDAEDRVVEEARRHEGPRSRLEPARVAVPIAPATCRKNTAMFAAMSA